MTQAQLALVTGASSGIGLELAKQFARHGYDLVVAADDDAIRDVPDKLSRWSSAVQPVQVDLRAPEGVEHLYRSAIEGDRVLAAAALNAGIGRGEMFLKSELADDLSIVDLNVRSTVHLAKLVLRDMANRDAGRVLFTSSIAAQMPGSYQPVYNASKSFIQSFAEALQDELRDTSITVTALMPGPTDTNFFARAKMVDSLMGKGPKDDPAEVARQGFEALMRGDRQVVAGSVLVKAMGVANRVLPDSVKAIGNRVMSRPR
ncbi:oxidoreductase, short chain dehydrogenase/reductase family protein [Mycobacterium parascrofulaceum ATCC BAA-614]|uniref:Oxidoreductase, short chain dehydrogenase/reductase family protein n=1 Tax=Mycobacterium parascrofulaceum ATCC BAA-614 TaxID=525368 RepID=D5P7P5_9MYCO|nr:MULTISPECIES: SDR family NAD(P)-dependent oxidoreductase [Mycobacterium]EFG77889.1 oxidoreductase, short chain dehydrogenase/reductase family protein [Mycobacterium parascrofulaceum ATCC BAA-614]OCB50617.1 oxidoreductase [Mycobacterium malmoense]